MFTKEVIQVVVNIIFVDNSKLINNNNIFKKCFYFFLFFSLTLKYPFFSHGWDFLASSPFFRYVIDIICRELELLSANCKLLLFNKIYSFDPTLKKKVLNWEHCGRIKIRLLYFVYFSNIHWNSKKCRRNSKRIFVWPEIYVTWLLFHYEPSWNFDFITTILSQFWPKI